MGGRLVMKQNGIRRPLQATCSASSGSLSKLQVGHVLSTFSFKSFDSLWAALLVLTRFRQYISGHKIDGR